jgi:hypothetical protein
MKPSWLWRDYFGLYPAVLITVNVEEAQFVKNDTYPKKESFPTDRIATLEALQSALRKINIVEGSEWTTALLVRFSHRSVSIAFDDHNLSHFSLEAAHYLKDVLKCKIVAVQAPSLDRADCPGCDVHRILFGLKEGQVVLKDEEQPSTLIAGENFHFDDAHADGKYVLECSGVDWLNQDVTISASAFYKV